MNPEEAKNFIEWHDETKLNSRVEKSRVEKSRVDLSKVDLYQIEPSEVEHILEGYPQFKNLLRYEIGKIDSIELGIWTKYILIFIKEEGKYRTHIIGSESDEGKKDENLFNEINSFYNEIEDKAKGNIIHNICDKEIECAKAANPIKLNNFNKLKSIWRDYIGCDKRLEIEAPFLEKIFRENGITPKGDTLILDAGGGIGCESRHLTRHKYQIRYNEYDENLRGIGINYLKSAKGIKKDTIGHINWQQLDLYFCDQFDAIMVLGNFFSLIIDDNEREKCIDNFYECLKPGGILIIDQRNFTKILKNKGSILSNPGPDEFSKILNKYSTSTNPPQYLPIMFCGEHIKGWPKGIGKINHYDTITFAYGEDKNNEIDTLTMRISNNSEMRRLLHRFNFKKVYEYPDLQFIDNKHENYQYLVDNADFHTFVAVK